MTGLDSRKRNSQCAACGKIGHAACVKRSRTLTRGTDVRVTSPREITQTIRLEPVHLDGKWMLEMKVILNVVDVTISM